ncbi:hypothetical protein Lser_V15G44337 [Lactuca serriola]
MAGFHHPGDPYFPNQGNNGWLEELEEEPEEEPEEDPEEEEEPEEEHEEEPVGGPTKPLVDSDEEEVKGDDSDDSDTGFEVINPLKMPQRPNRGNSTTPTLSEINSVAFQAAVSAAVTEALVQIHNGNNKEGNGQGTGSTYQGTNHKAT